MVLLPSVEDRQFVTDLNALSEEYSSATFGSPGNLVPTKARRQLAFALGARQRWPDLGGGDLRTAQVNGWNTRKVDPDCGFWLEGQRRYSSALTAYFDAIREAGVATQRSLLADLGFHIVEEFSTEVDERELLEYWRPGGPVHALGEEEQHSQRRFFNYGPILQRRLRGTAKSTLGVIPARFGGMPPVVEKQQLRERVRSCSQRLFCARGDRREHEFDQMYVNHYDASIGSYIDFHHDHTSAMLGVVAGVSLASDCELQLRPLDRSIRRAPIRIRIPRRSLFFLSGLSRWHLQHAIPHITEDRLSLTFRTADRSSHVHLWDRAWDCLTPDETKNAIWPLVRPDGVELHTIRAPPRQLSKRASRDWGDPKHSSGPRQHAVSLGEFMPADFVQVAGESSVSSRGCATSRPSSDVRSCTALDGHSHAGKSWYTACRGAPPWGTRESSDIRNSGDAAMRYGSPWGIREFGDMGNDGFAARGEASPWGSRESSETRQTGAAARRDALPWGAAAPSELGSGGPAVRKDVSTWGTREASETGNGAFTARRDASLWGGRESSDVEHQRRVLDLVKCAHTFIQCAGGYDGHEPGGVAVALDEWSCQAAGRRGDPVQKRVWNGHGRRKPGAAARGSGPAFHPQREPPCGFWARGPPANDDAKSKPVAKAPPAKGDPKSKAKGLSASDDPASKTLAEDPHAKGGPKPKTPAKDTPAKGDLKSKTLAEDPHAKGDLKSRTLAKGTPAKGDPKSKAPGRRWRERGQAPHDGNTQPLGPPRGGKI